MHRLNRLVSTGVTSGIQAFRKAGASSFGLQAFGLRDLRADTMDEFSIVIGGFREFNRGIKGCAEEDLLLKTKF